MDAITKELNKYFSNKYDFLKLLEVVYDKRNFCCTLTFLYPETKSEIDEQSRSEIFEFLKKFLALDSKLEVKYKKSFLDDSLVQTAVMEYFKTHNKSIFTNLTKDDILVKRDASITVILSLPEMFNEYIKTNQIQQKLKDYLEHRFIAEFFVNLIVENTKIDNDLLQMRRLNVPTPVAKKIKRYEVFESAVLLGREIPTFPELIREQKSEKQSVILAGKISNINKKEFKSKRAKATKSDVMNHYYTFELNDATGTILCIYFSSISNEVKLDKLFNDMSYLFQGDIRQNQFGKFTYFIRYINTCRFDENLSKQQLQHEEHIKVELKDEYQFVYPKTYYNPEQSKLFDIEYYNDFIMDNTFVVFDVETTGLDASNCEIIEVGACKVEKGVITKIFQSLVKPKRSIPEMITKITSIDNFMVKDSPPIEQVLVDFALFAKDCVLSGYNVGFDMGFIKNAGKEIGIVFENRVEDVMIFAREKMVIGNYTLKNVANHLNVSLNNAHRALNDALATANVLLKLNISQKK